MQRDVKPLIVTVLIIAVIVGVIFAAFVQWMIQHYLQRGALMPNPHEDEAQNARGPATPSAAAFRTVPVTAALFQVDTTAIENDINATGLAVQGLGKAMADLLTQLTGVVVNQQASLNSLHGQLTQALALLNAIAAHITTGGSPDALNALTAQLAQSQTALQAAINALQPPPAAG